MECTYYRYTENGKFDQSTCGAPSFGDLDDPALENIGIGLERRLEGRSLIGQRAETLHTHTGSIRGSFVSFLQVGHTIHIRSRDCLKLS